MPLTARQVEVAKPKGKIYRITDGGGLYLQVNPDGLKYWRMKHHYAGKEEKLSSGTYPTIILAEARKRRDEAKKIHVDGKDPGGVEKTKNLEKSLSEGRTLATIAIEWYSVKASGWSASYADYVDRAFKNNVFPYIGNRPISGIEPLELFAILQHIGNRGTCGLANKVRQRCSEVFRYAIVADRARYNPVSDLVIAIESYKRTYYPFLLPSELPEFLYGLENYTGSIVAREVIKLLILTGLRIVELRMGERCEIGFSQKIWEVSPTRMKMRREYIIPLSNQAIRSPRILKELTGGYRHILTGRSDINGLISDVSVNMILKKIDYDRKAAGRGFHHTMSTTLRGKGLNSTWIET